MMIMMMMMLMTMIMVMMMTMRTTMMITMMILKITTLLWTMARVSTQTRHPPYSNLIAWWSNILNESILSIN